MTLDQIEILFTKPPKEIFGDDIEKTRRELEVHCHPDKHIGEEVRAKNLFTRIAALADSAQKPVVKLKSPKREYSLHSLMVAGDVADIYAASGGGKDYIVKISRLPNTEKLLDVEKQVMTDIFSAADDTSYSKYFPLFVESFPIKDKFAKRANVFIQDPGFYTLEAVLKRHPLGLDSRHLAWIIKRVLVGLGFAHRQNWVHGAALPNHIMISPASHGANIVGWGQAVRPGQRVTVASKKYMDWYPAEVIKKLPVSPATDIYTAVKCLAMLAGGDGAKGIFPETVPVQLRRFFRSCLLESQKARPDDAWKLHDELSELLQSMYGAPRFVKLAM